jgi:hypothetical protein
VSSCLVRTCGSKSGLFDEEFPVRIRDVRSEGPGMAAHLGLDEVGRRWPTGSPAWRRLTTVPRLQSSLITYTFGCDTCRSRLCVPPPPEDMALVDLFCGA